MGLKEYESVKQFLKILNVLKQDFDGLPNEKLNLFKTNKDNLIL